MKSNNPHLAGGDKMGFRFIVIKQDYIRKIRKNGNKNQVFWIRYD